MAQYKSLEEKAEVEARKIVLSCRKSGFEIPLDKFTYGPGGQIGVAAYLKGRCCSYLGLVDVAESKIDEMTELVRFNLLDTYHYISQGMQTLDERNSSLIENTALAIFLNLYEYSAFKFEPPEHFFKYYFLLALESLVNFEANYLLSYADEDTFNHPEDAIKYLKHSIDAQGDLMVAQEAVRLGDACLERTFGNQRYNQKMSENELLLSELGRVNILAAGPQKLLEKNKTRSIEAQEKWLPIVEAVNLLLNNGSKHSIRGACEIVSRKFDVNPGTLNNKYHDWKKRNLE